MPLILEDLQATLEAVNGWIAEKVAAYGFRLADIAGAFLGHEAEYLCYRIEPTLKGASVIAGLFEQAMDQYPAQEAGRQQSV